MSKLTANTSRVVLALSWLFILAFFNDAANLTDLISDTSTYHFDEGDGSEAISRTLDFGAGAATVANPTWHFAQKSFHSSKVSPIRHVVLDEDSPSLAAIRVVFSHPYFLYPQENTPVIKTVDLSESLYLHCTLLL